MLISVTLVIQLSLFAADLLHASGETLNWQWLHDGKVYTGSVCNAQGEIPPHKLSSAGLYMMVGIIQAMGCTAIGLTTLVRLSVLI
jgi:hypothetical protein